jgi:hypothetical protein
MSASICGAEAAAITSALACVKASSFSETINSSFLEGPRLSLAIVCRLMPFTLLNSRPNSPA